LVNNSCVRFLAAEEKLVGDYRFGTYDLLVLPPSFPYGGMVRLPLVYTVGETGAIFIFTSGKFLSVVLESK